MEAVKTSLPEKLTFQWLKDHAEEHVIGRDWKWLLITWRNVSVLIILRDWTPEETSEYVDRLSGISSIASGKWKRVYLIFDLTLMEFKKEDAPRYLRSNWLKAFDRQDISVFLVDENRMRRILWWSLYKLLGEQDRIKIFSNCDVAMSWVRKQIVWDSS